MERKVGDTQKSGSLDITYLAVCEFHRRDYLFYAVSDPGNELMADSASLLIFDIDGTLLLTGGAGKIAFEQIFEETFGIKDVWRNAQPHGKTDQIIFREVAEAVLNRPITVPELEELSAGYLRYFDDALERAGNFRLMPGVTELIDLLDRDQDFLLGIGTGNYKKAADSKLQYARLKHYFHFGGYACDSEVRSELIAAAVQKGRNLAESKKIRINRIFVIGDTPFDILAGQANQAITIGVTTGGYQAEDLKKHHPDHVLEDLSDIQRFCEIVRNS